MFEPSHQQSLSFTENCDKKTKISEKYSLHCPFQKVMLLYLGSGNLRTRGRSPPPSTVQFLSKLSNDIRSNSSGGGDSSGGRDQRFKPNLHSSTTAMLDCDTQLDDVLKAQLRR